MCDPGQPLDPSSPAYAVEQTTLPMSDGVELPALLCRPPQTYASVVVAPDLFGLSPGTIGVMQRLASAGIASVALGYHWRWGPDTPEDDEAARDRRRRMDETVSIDDLATAMTWALRELPLGTRERIPVIGFCMGATMALALAARRHDQPAVSCYGFPRSSQMPAVAAPRPLDLAHATTGPILAVWGEADRSVPLADMHELVAAWERHRVEAQTLLYPEVGHGFLTAPDDASRGAADQAWPQITAFIKAHA